MAKRKKKNYLTTMKDFAKKNGYEYSADRWYCYIKTTNDRFKVRISELTRNSDDIYLFHENEGVGWHQQGKHPWSIEKIQEIIWEHDGLLTVHSGRPVMIVPKRGEIQYGKQWNGQEWI